MLEFLRFHISVLLLLYKLYLKDIARIKFHLNYKVRYFCKHLILLISQSMQNTKLHNLKTKVKIRYRQKNDSV